MATNNGVPAPYNPNNSVALPHPSPPEFRSLSTDLHVNTSTDISTGVNGQSESPNNQREGNSIPRKQQNIRRACNECRQQKVQYSTDFLFSPDKETHVLGIMKYMTLLTHYDSYAAMWSKTHPRFVHDAVNFSWSAKSTLASSALRRESKDGVPSLRFMSLTPIPDLRRCNVN
jgi:hypothetical protein